MFRLRPFVCRLMCAALVPLTAAAEPPAVAELPAPKVGDVWEFKKIDLWNNSELETYRRELVEIRPDHLVYRGKSAQNAEPKTFYHGRSLAPCRRMRESEEENCVGALAFPLHVGNKNRYEKRPWRTGDGHYSADCEVKAIESVTVPAGTFDAFRVDCDGTWQRVFDITPTTGVKGRFEESLWYSPKVGNYVKSTYIGYRPSGGVFTREQTELIEFLPK
ncbi:MAG: hypothetical protein JNM54_08545 [Candidatus Accumulibacter sp.]|jgi:hypothetical protein|uniref:hypothetical protein n=1 Tax=unclassified Candidatus Accumulibacter TaxID=2619054 RepID=UPI001A42CE04|nr:MULTISPECIES: hypothetical protein [unclassified Candidatus Accumulibacter]MBL8367950.1 hypothetical protein [Accumulibacter sp.]